MLKMRGSSIGLIIKSSLVHLSPGFPEICCSIFTEVTESIQLDQIDEELSVYV